MTLKKTSFQQYFDCCAGFLVTWFLTNSFGGKKSRNHRAMFSGKMRKNGVPKK